MLMTLAEIAQGYRDALSKISARQAQLQEQLNSAPDYTTRQELRHLLVLKRDLRELAELCERYYERGYWRSKKYTSNPAARRNPGCHRKVAKRERGGQRRSSSQTAEESGQSNPGRANSAAERTAADALLRQFFSERDRS